MALANSNGCPVTSVVGTPVTFTAPVERRQRPLRHERHEHGHGRRGRLRERFRADVHRQRHGGQLHGDRDQRLRVGLVLVDEQRRRDPGDDHAALARLQSAAVNSDYAQQLSVRVLDAGGNPVSGATVTFTLGTAGGGGGRRARRARGRASPTAARRRPPQPTATGSPPRRTSRRTRPSAASPRPRRSRTCRQPAQFQLENLPGKGERLIAARQPPGARRRSSTATAAGCASSCATPTAIRKSAPPSPSRSAAPAGLAARGRRHRGGRRSRASFAGGTSTATATTGIHGIATSPSITAGSVAGTFTATATTTTTTSTARFTLQQPRRQAGHDHRRHRRHRSDPGGDALRDRARRHRHRRARQQGPRRARDIHRARQRRERQLRHPHPPAHCLGPDRLSAASPSHRRSPRTPNRVATS